MAKTTPYFRSDAAGSSRTTVPTAAPSGTGFAPQPVGGGNAGTIGNLSSAMLSAANTNVPQHMGGKIMGADSLMSAYLGGSPQQQFTSC